MKIGGFTLKKNIMSRCSRKYDLSLTMVRSVIPFLFLKRKNGIPSKVGKFLTHGSSRLIKEFLGINSC